VGCLQALTVIFTRSARRCLVVIAIAAMSSAHLRFYAELNDFLSHSRRQVTFVHAFATPLSVKDLIESLGVPHTEVDLILVNGESKDFVYQVKDKDRVSVYPVFESMDIRPLLHLHPQPLRETKFVLDVHLGRLAAYLRMLGFDSLYSNNAPDEELARVSFRQKRILLTRDRGLLKRSLVTHGYWVREIRPRQQLLEILRRFDLFGSIQAFQRCLRCNSQLKPIDKQLIVERLPLHTRQTREEFQRCPECDRIYWKGSHYERMMTFLERLVKTPSATEWPQEARPE
jgi:uncharacterized protein with PIN domain